MTLNYENLIERAARCMGFDVDYSLTFAESTSSSLGRQRKPVTILKLHGSFNWRNEFPLSIEDGLEDDADILWIPPGVEKHNENYPFNILWGKARELLNCDVLRVIGCSLSRNDWRLVSLLYTTQRLNKRKKGYTIEIISPPATGDSIEEKYPHLRIRKVYELKEIRDFVFASLYKQHGTTAARTMDDQIVVEYLGKKNIFETWLKAKGDALLNDGVDILTTRNIFSDLVRGN